MAVYMVVVVGCELRKFLTKEFYSREEKCKLTTLKQNKTKILC